MHSDTRLPRLYRPFPFFSIDFLLTWIPLWLLVAGLRSGWLSTGTGLLVLAGSSSTLAAAWFVYRTRNRVFIRDFWIRVVDPFRISPLWWTVILLSQAAVNIMAILISLLVGGSPGQLDFSPQFLAAPLGFIFFTFLFGPLPEEIGWRGYGLDALRSRMNLLKTSLVLAFIWGIWHLPMVFLPGSFQNNLLQSPAVLASFFFAFLPSSILMSWIYYRTGRSTLSAILFHFAGNLSGEIFSMSLETRIFQTALLTLWAAAVLAKEWTLFTDDEFHLDFTAPGKPEKTSLRGRVPRSVGGILFTVFVLLLLPGQVRAATPWDTVALPYCFYTSDTGFAGGGLASTVHSSVPPATEKVREDLHLLLAATWSQKNQKEVNLSFEKNFLSRRLFWLTNLRYSDFPGEFYGFGPSSREGETFISEGIEIDTAVLKGISGVFHLGPLFQLGTEQLSMISADIDPKSTFLGSGLMFRLDSRDNPRSPASGSVMELRPVFFLDPRDAGSNFVQVETDLRAYLSLSGPVVTALRVSGVLNNGEPPLREMASLGGLYCMRGLPEGRYIDRNGLSLQGELRFPLYRRLGGVIFCAAGSVFSSPAEFHPKDLKYSGGGGFRFALNERGDTKLRLDYGFGTGHSGLYITLMEAF